MGVDVIALLRFSGYSLYDQDVKYYKIKAIAEYLCNRHFKINEFDNEFVFGFTEASSVGKLIPNLIYMDGNIAEDKKADEIAKLLIKLSSNISQASFPNVIRSLNTSLYKLGLFDDSLTRRFVEIFSSEESLCTFGKVIIWSFKKNFTSGAEKEYADKYFSEIMSLDNSVDLIVSSLSKESLGKVVSIKGLIGFEKYLSNDDRIAKFENDLGM